MKTLKLGTNFTVFLIFFGIATLEAFQTYSWIKAILFVALGLMFLLNDVQKPHVRN